MRDEDEEFADIVKQEFDEHWNPPATPPREPKAPMNPQPGPAPDFHLNLYDDDESYRDIPRTAWKMSPLMSRGLIAIAIGLIVAVAKIVFTRMPMWTGWIAVACFIAGVTMCIWHLTHAPKNDDQDGTV